MSQFWKPGLVHLLKFEYQEAGVAMSRTTVLNPIVSLRAILVVAKLSLALSLVFNQGIQSNGLKAAASS